jgi:hypothetical protein
MLICTRSASAADATGNGAESSLIPRSWHVAWEVPGVVFAVLVEDVRLTGVWALVFAVLVEDVRLKGLAAADLTALG